MRRTAHGHLLAANQQPVSRDDLEK